MEYKGKTHRDLEVWKRSISFVTKVYQITGPFPKEEMYGLTNQKRQAAISVPSSIAEGAARRSKKNLFRFSISLWGVHRSKRLDFLLQIILNIFVKKILRSCAERGMR